MKNRSIDIYADYVVVGGGLPGMCSAIQAARMGLKTVLINNRPYFGGNASAELMISVGGATWMQEFNFHARETGVIEEILLEDQKRNPHDNRWIWNTVLLDILMKEKNLTLYPNTCIDEVVKKKDDEIEYVAGLQITTETNYRFHAPIFADDTGDGTVAYLSGAEYRYGREAKAEFHERIAPDVEDSSVLPSTMVFFADKRDYPVPYYAPAFATDITKTYVLDYREIPQKGFEQFQWFYEIDGRLDQVYEAETITEHHRALVYGIWDYIKNSGKYPAENYELSYISPIPGNRESRRFLGDYILTESDIVNRK